MRTILRLVALAVLLTGCATTTSTSTPEKPQRTQEERSRDAQGGGSY